MPRRAIGFIFRPKGDDAVKARAWLGLTDIEIKLYLIPESRPADIIKRGDVIVTFGTTSRLLIQSITKETPDTDHIALPAMNRLSNKQGNEEFRRKSQKKLKTIKDLVSKSIAPDNIEEVSSLDLPQEENWEVRFIQDSDTKFYTARSGKRIQVGGERNNDIDIYLTVSELLTVSQIMKTLGAKEVKLERPIKTDTTLPNRSSTGENSMESNDISKDQ